MKGRVFYKFWVQFGTLTCQRVRGSRERLRIAPSPHTVTRWMEKSITRINEELARRTRTEAFLEVGDPSGQVW